MRYEPTPITKLIPIGEVCQQTSLAKSCVYDYIKNGEFPKPRQLTRGRVAVAAGAKVGQWSGSAVLSRGGVKPGHWIG